MVENHSTSDRGHRLSSPALRRTRRALLLGVARGPGALYVAFLGAIKVFGWIPPAAGPPPEVTTDDGRLTVLPLRPGRWPELRVLLPDSALYAFPVESVFGRSALWRSPAEERVADGADA